MALYKSKINNYIYCCFALCTAIAENIYEQLVDEVKASSHIFVVFNCSGVTAQRSDTFNYPDFISQRRGILQTLWSAIRKMCILQLLVNQNQILLSVQQRGKCHWLPRQVQIDVVTMSNEDGKV